MTNPLKEMELLDSAFLACVWVLVYLELAALGVMFFWSDGCQWPRYVLPGIFIVWPVAFGLIEWRKRE